MSLTVKTSGPPKLSQIHPVPVPYRVQDGARVEFPCLLQGTPWPRVEWFSVEVSQYIQWNPLHSLVATLAPLPLSLSSRTVCLSLLRLSTFIFQKLYEILSQYTFFCSLVSRLKGLPCMYVCIPKPLFYNVFRMEFVPLLRILVDFVSAHSASPL